MLVNPRVDFAFKKLFGSDENKDLLMSFINSIVDKKDQVAEIEIKNPYNEKEHFGDKLSMLDIKAKDKSGKYFNIEVQVCDQVYYDKRALYYWSKLYSSQLKVAGKYSSLAKTISIHVLNFNCLDEKDYHNVFRLMNVKSQKVHFEDMELHFIELEKFNKDIKHLKTVLDRWATFLTKAHEYSKDKIPTELSKVPEIKKAIVELEHMYFDEKEQDLYDARLKWMLDEDAALEAAEYKGKAEGKTERNIEIAKSLLKKGLSIKEISEVTGLSEQEIKKL